MAHTNGIESFRAMQKRDRTGTFHKISPKSAVFLVRDLIHEAQRLTHRVKPTAVSSTRHLFGIQCLDAASRIN